MTGCSCRHCGENSTKCISNEFGSVSMQKALKASDNHKCACFFSTLYTYLLYLYECTIPEYKSNENVRPGAHYEMMFIFVLEMQCMIMIPLTTGVARNSPLAKFSTIGLSAHASSISTSSISQGIGLGLGLELGLGLGLGLGS